MIALWILLYAWAVAALGLGAWICYVYWPTWRTSRRLAVARKALREVLK
jgi:hypothetical protein